MSINLSLFFIFSIILPGWIPGACSRNDADMEKKEYSFRGIDVIHIESARGNIASIQALHESDREVIHLKGPGGNQPIHWAALYGHIPVIEYLLENGVSLETPNDIEETPLHLAAKGNKLETVDFLISSGANVSAEQKEGLTPLSLAAKNEACSIMTLLLEAGADPNPGVVSAVWLGQHTDALRLLMSFGISEEVISEALERSIDCVYAEAVNILLRHGARPSIWTDDIMGDINGVKDALLSEPDILYATRSFGMGLLHVAAIVNNPDMVELLLNEGININVTGEYYDYSPIEIAANAGAWRAAKYLRSRGAQYNIFDAARFGDIFFVSANLTDEYISGKQCEKRGQNLLHHAIQTGQIELVRYLLLKGMRPQWRMRGNDWDGLRTAVTEDHHEIVQLLLTHMPAHLPSLYGVTPLHVAKVNTVPILLSAGADPLYEDVNGRTPIDWAIERRDWKKAMDTWLWLWRSEK